ncbi:Dicarboxylate transport [Sphingomonas laterariae]|uniref:Dicarboxylate transport n=2 Tax=Edaphosphingomonas laterariae TaxID=861865 RepID=A0A239G6Q5_9SPHN|nr:Dicarboxylate transport [Sphingomonas laterariae]
MDEGETVRPPKRIKRLAAGLALPAVVLGVLWFERRPIAEHYVDRALAERGLPARYRIAALGPFTQRLEDVSLGDPARPDLTADWAELRLAWGFGGPQVVEVRAGGVRLNGRLVDGKLNLGSLDRLMPAPTGAPFALPDLRVALDDARLGLETPAGRIGLALDGQGNLARDFRGRLRLHAPRLSAGDCNAVGLLIAAEVRTAKSGIALDGPVDLGSLACDGAGGLGQVKGRARLKLAGDLGDAEGDVSLLAANGQIASVTAKDWRFVGKFAADLDAGEGGLEGDIGFVDAAAPADLRASLRDYRGALAGSPVAPLVPPLVDALAGASGDVDGKARLLLRHGRTTDVHLRDIALESATAARLTLRDGKGIGWSSAAGITADGALRLAGGGLPEIAGRLAIAGGGGEGRFTVAPIAAGGARLALAPIRIDADGGSYRVQTAATLDGPLGDGAVRGLAMPLTARIGGNGAIALNTACAPLSFESLAVAGIRLAPARLPLCPTGKALVTIAPDGGVGGGGAIPGLKLAGHVGGAPLTIVNRRFGFDIGRPGFIADTVAIRLGAGDSVSRLDVDRLTGQADARGLAGRFEGAAGQIGAVPLLLSEGQGDWRLANADLSLTGRLKVADAAADPRFEPLISDDVRLSLIDGRIHATGQLRQPETNVAVAAVRIDHDLAKARGTALLDVPGITFGRALQPERLTRLTFGVVANVEGTVRGEGRIDWNDAGVTSTGAFRTDSLDLAAAFGPVRGLAGEIRFSDLLGLETPPGQEVRLAEVNPGVAVTDGLIRYQLLPGQKLRVEGGRWPFSGGELFLEPTVMDFAQPVARHMTFRVAGLDAAQFIQQFEFENIAGTGIFDGTLPMVFDDSGGRIENGLLKVREGGGTLAYVGELSNEDLGTFGKMAFDALKSMRYDNLAIRLDGNLDGEIVSEILFTGINERPIGGEKLEGMAEELTGLPFRFNITVRAPFRGLVSTASNFIDPTALIRNQKPGDSPKPVQTQESEDKR